MDSHSKWRLRARAALEVHFRKRSHPRFILGLIVIIAGMAGFLVSYVLLHCGLEAMWLRYPIAVIGGYVVFLAILRLWVEIERDRYDPGKVIIPTDLPNESTSPPQKKFISDSGTWLDWLDCLDVSDLFDVGDGCLVGCLIMIIIGAFAGMGSLLFSFIMTGPELLAEVFLDAVVVTMLYRHLKNAAREHWLGTAVKRTLRPTFLIAGALSLIGGGLDMLAPHSNSIGTALKEILPFIRSK